MLLRHTTIAVLLLLAITLSTANALTMQQFSKLCASATGECSDHPIVQAYIGGALDLLATLDENTNYLDTLYCAEPKTLFDVAAITRFMQAHTKEYANQNAMLVVVRYFEKNGGCNNDE